MAPTQRRPGSFPDRSPGEYSELLERTTPGPQRPIDVIGDVKKMKRIVFAQEKVDGVAGLLERVDTLEDARDNTLIRDQKAEQARADAAKDWRKLKFQVGGAVLVAAILAIGACVFEAIRVGPAKPEAPNQVQVEVRK